MKPLMRLGMVGAGLIWRKAHRRVIETMKEQFVIAGFCVTSEKSRQWVAGEHPGVRIYSDYKELAASEDIDALVILTPIALNAEVAIAGLNAGKDVFVEKPIAASSAQAEAVIEAAERMKKRVFVLENAFYDPKWANVKMALDDNSIGGVVMYEDVAHGLIDDDAHDAGGYGRTQWRKDAKFPLGTLFDGGIHGIAVHAKLFGNPVSVCAGGAKFRDGFGDYDEVSMFFLSPAKGLKGFYSHAGYLSPKHNHFQICGERGTIAFEGGAVVIEKADGLTTTIPAPKETSQQAMWRTFAEVIERGAVIPYDARQAAFDVRVLEAVEKAIGTAASVPI